MCDQILQKRLYFCLNELINDKDVLDFVNDYQIIENNYYLTDLYSDNGIKEGMISFEFNERTLINESIFYKGTLKIYINDLKNSYQKIEQIAREKYGLTKEKEKVYKVIIDSTK